tara:strand:- start:67 stop:273 length:207 start_codon:yes stop_codon:yes gene_type:complete
VVPKQDWKNLSLIDEDLVKFLQRKYPPIEYDPEVSSDGFLQKTIFRSGQREVITAIQQIIEHQKQRKR